MSDFDTTDHLEPKKEILLRPKKDVVLPKDNKLISEFSEEVAKQSRIFSIMDESIVSRISILQNNERYIDRFIPTYANTN